MENKSLKVGDKILVTSGTNYARGNGWIGKIGTIILVDENEPSSNLKFRIIPEEDSTKKFWGNGIPLAGILKELV